MKKYLVGVLAICMLFVLSGCGCERRKEKDTIIGKWTIEKIQNGPVTITFKEDNTIEYKNANFTGTGTYKVNDNYIVVEGVWRSEEEYEFEFNDGKLTLNAVYEDSLSYPNMTKIK